MTELSGNLAKPTSTGIQLTPIAVACLFFFALWQVSGISLTLSYQPSEATSEQILAGLEDRASGQAGIIDILKWCIFASIGILLHFVNKNRALFTWAKAWPLLLLLVLITLSILWSAVPDIAFRRVVRHLLLVAVLAGVVIGVRSPREILRLAVVFTGLMMVMNVASVFLFPGVAFDTSGALQGLHPHKNAAGGFTMITIFVWFSAARCSDGIFTRTILLSGTLMWFLFLFGTDSRTSIGSTILAIIVIVLLRHLIRSPILMVICSFAASVLALLAIYLTILLNVSFYDIVDFIEGERTTLTARFIVWDLVYESFLNHMVLGTGFGSLWSTGSSAPAVMYGNVPPTKFLVGLTHAHNGYIDILATLGIIGAVAFLVFLGSVFMAVIRAFKPDNLEIIGAPMAEISGFVFLAIIVGNITKTTFFAPNMVWSSLIICYLMLCSVRYPADAESTSASEPA
jgi:O-antigen ligase